MILKRNNLEICKHSSFLIAEELVFSSNLVVRNVKISKLSLLIKPIEQ